MNFDILSVTENARLSRVFEFVNIVVLVLVVKREVTLQYHNGLIRQLKTEVLNCNCCYTYTGGSKKHNNEDAG